MKSLFIPESLLPTFKTGGLKESDWLSPALLTNIVSPADVAFYINANIRSGVLVSPVLNSSFPNAIVASDTWSEILQPENTTPAIREFKRILNKLAQEEDESLQKSSNGMVPVVVSADEHLLVYTLAQPTGETDWVSDMIERVHPFYAFDELAKLPIFALYLTASLPKHA